MFVAYELRRWDWQIKNSNIGYCQYAFGFQTLVVCWSTIFMWMATDDREAYNFEMLEIDLECLGPILNISKVSIVTKNATNIIILSSTF